MSNISYYGMRTIVLMKLKIFFKEFQYSILSPIISSIIFIVILDTISKFYGISINSNYRYMDFVIPGIIIMIVIQETYANISETLIHMKQTGSFNDILMSPISRIEIALSLILASIFIGLIISIINLIIINIFFDIHFYNFLRITYYLSITSIIFGSMGCIIGFISYTWDSQQSFFNFFIVPISLLSGTFFSVTIIEAEWKNIFLFNPFYYLVSCFRKGFYNNQIYDLKVDVILIILGFFLVYITTYIFKKGYKVIH